MSRIRCGCICNFKSSSHSLCTRATAALASEISNLKCEMSASSSHRAAAPARCNQPSRIRVLRLLFLRRCKFQGTIDLLPGTLSQRRGQVCTGGSQLSAGFPHNSLICRWSVRERRRWRLAEVLFRVGRWHQERLLRRGRPLLFPRNHGRYPGNPQNRIQQRAIFRPQPANLRAFAHQLNVAPLDARFERPRVPRSRQSPPHFMQAHRAAPSPPQQIQRAIVSSPHLIRAACAGAQRKRAAARAIPQSALSWPG